MEINTRKRGGKMWRWSPKEVREGSIRTGNSDCRKSQNLETLRLYPDGYRP